MKFLYLVLASLPLLAVAAPAYPSGYVKARHDSDADLKLAKRQVTVAELKRRADAGDTEHKKKNQASYYNNPYYPRATDAA